MTTRKFAIARAVGIIGATAALVTGVTFAGLTSSATLSDNTVNTATANLLVSAHGSDFTHSEPGFAFTDVIPGGAGSANSTFALENDQTDNALGLTVQATTPAGEPNITDNSLVHINFTNSDDANPTSYTLAQLLAGPQAFDAPLPATVTHNYTVNVTMDAGAVSGSSSGSIGSFDLVFTGTAQ